MNLTFHARDIIILSRFFIYHPKNDHATYLAAIVTTVLGTVAMVVSVVWLQSAQAPLHTPSQQHHVTGVITIQIDFLQQSDPPHGSY